MSRSLRWCFAVALGACDEGSTPPPPPPAGLGGPLAGISDDLAARFQLGRDEFVEVEEEGEGLGPLFNARACGECHDVPALGGAGVISIVRAGSLDAMGTFTEPPGGSLIHLFSIAPAIARAEIPRSANVIATRASPPLFGMGLVEAIPDEEIAAQAARTDRPPGIGGRVNWVQSPSDGGARAGRFGVKAQHATLVEFSADAYRNELGITNEIAATEIAPGGDLDVLAALDRIGEPEAEIGAVGRLADFVRLLAPVQPADTSSVGAAIFAAVGCDGCHRPSYRTGSSSDPAFDDVDVPLFSDLLLHDIGTGDGIGQAGANPGEMRTTPLWGLRDRTRLLHDGSRIGAAAAIAAHEGEAAAVRARFDALSAADRAALLEFLSAL